MFLIEYIKKYKVTYFSVVVTFIVGICIGIFVTFKMPEKYKVKSKLYVQETIQIIENKKIDKKEFFKEKLFEDLKDTRNNMVFRLLNNSKFYNLYFYDL